MSKLMRILKGSISIEEATTEVVNYFWMLHKGLGLLDFKIGDVHYKEKKKLVRIDCSFYDKIDSTERTFYRLDVHYINGILCVEKR